MNKDFYPTPMHLIHRMYNKIPKQDRHSIQYILEPQAGDGKIVEHIKTDNRSAIIHAIEIDPELQTILRGKNINLVDSDFLAFSGPDKYDLIIGNPPFCSGDVHLLKAIDIMYSGHIVFLLNSETIRNPYTNTRKLLIQKLNDLKADVEFIQDAFLNADRTTGVEVALIYIRIDRQIETDLFGGVKNACYQDVGEAYKNTEITERDSIMNLVASYDRTVRIGTESLLGFYKNYHAVSKFLQVSVKDMPEPKNYATLEHEKLTAIMKSNLNMFLASVRKSYWRQILSFEKVESRMTVRKLKEFNKHLQDNSLMDFTEQNIRTFVLNLMGNYETILKEAVLDMFDNLTIKYAYDEKLHTDNIHYFNGWKTNQAYRVNKKVVIPFNSRAFTSWVNGKWELDYSIKDQLRDFDKVANYFDDRSEYVSIVEAINNAFDNGQSSGILSTYFKITCYKKGTMHLVFLDDDILRRFNVTACKSKNWLPHDYGNKSYQDLSPEEACVVESFEGKKSYELNITPGRSLFYQNNFLQIAA